MADEIKKVISVDVSDSINKVKSLKKEVEDLQKVFDKPMKLNVSGIQEQLKNIQKSLSNVTDGLKTSDLSGKMDEIRNLGNAIASSLEVVKKSIGETLNVKDLQSKLETIISLVKKVTDVISTDVTQSISEVKTVVVETREEIAKPFTIEFGNAPTTVKELKTEISTLKDALLNLEAGTDDYNAVVERLVQDQTRLNEVVNAGKSNASAAEGSYNALKNEMKALQDVWKTVTDEQTRADLGNKIRDINDQLKALDATIGNHQRNVGNYAGAFKDLRQEIQEARDVMAGAIPGTDEYSAAAQRAADAMDKLNDIQKLVREGASGLDNKFAVTANVMGSLSGGFTAAQGVMALFGAESENLQKTMVKLQAAMSITGGLKALATLPKSLKSAQVAFGGVTKGVNTFIKSLRGVKAAIAATGLGLLVVLLGELIANWESVTDWIEKTIGSLDHLKEVVMGVYNVIKTFLIAPFRAIGQLVKGNFAEAADEMKKAFDVAANYSKGAEEQATKNAEKESQKRMAQYDKEKDEYIKDNEAKYGSDWKYTKEGQKAYREMFENRLKMYKKDSDEYKAAQRGLWSFERDLLNRRTKNGNDGAKAIAKANAEAIRDVEDAQTEIEKKIRTNLENINKEYMDEVNSFKGVIEPIFNAEPLLSYNQKLIEGVEEQYEGLKDKIKNVLGSDFSIFEDALNQKDVETFNKMLERLPSSWTDVLTDMFNRPEIAISRLIKSLEQGGTEVTTEINNLAIESYKHVDSSLGLTLNDYYKFQQAVIQSYKDRNNKIKIENEKAADEWAMTLINDYEETAKLTENDYERMLRYPKELVEEWSKLGKEITIPDVRKDLQDYISGNKTAIDSYNEVIEGTKNSFLDFFKWRADKSEENYQFQIQQNDEELKWYSNSIDAKIAMIDAQLADEKLSADTRMQLESEVAALSQEKSQATYETWKKNKQLELAEFKKVEAGKRQLAHQTTDFLGAMSDLAAEYSKESGDEASQWSKGFAIAQTVFSTYLSAQESYQSMASIPYVGPALGAVAAATAIVSGLANVRAIMNQDTQGKSANLSNQARTTSAVAVPNVDTNPYQYTRNITTAEEEDMYNRPIEVKAYISETDLQESEDRRQSRKNETTF